MQVKASVVLALTVALLGLVLFAIGLYYFNDLFFLESRTGLEDVPEYAQTAVAPVLLGVLLILDGIMVAGLRTRWVLPTLVLGNLLWAFAVIQLINLLLVRQTILVHYQLSFLAIGGAAVLFILGGIIDTVSGRRH